MHHGFFFLKYLWVYSFSLVASTLNLSTTSFLDYSERLLISEDAASIYSSLTGKDILLK